MKKVISLKSFAESGKFGRIELGATKSEVIRILGSDFEFIDGEESCIIQYGWYEFFFWTDSEKLFGIQNDHLQANCTNHDEMIEFENDTFKIDTWFLTVGRDYTFSDVISVIGMNQLRFKIEELYKDGPEVLKFDSGVYFDFSSGSYTWYSETNQVKETFIENQGDYLLNGIRLFDLSKNRKTS